MAHRPRVTVVGLGPAGTDLVGDNVSAQMAAAPGRAYLRTARHPAAARFEGVPAFDHLYEAAATFDEVYAGIVEALVAAAVEAAPEAVVYAVPGSPLVAERTVDLLRADGRVEVTALPALSFLDLAWAALGIDPLAEGVRLVDASAFGPVIAGESGPFLVAQCWSRHLLSEVKLAVPDDEGLELPRPVLLHHLGLEDEVVATVDWWELDRTVEPDHLTSLYVPRLVAADGHSAGDEVARLVALMDTLRARCPWDWAQTHASLMPHLIEESYEVLDALAGLAGSAAAPDATRTSRRSWATCSSRSSSTPGWRRRPGSSAWPTSRAASTTSSCTGTPMCSATSRRTRPQRSSRIGRRSRRPRRAAAASPRASRRVFPR